ncbi:MAG: 3-phosphoshikimate 1-carboxyvinyltransferase [Planctomycetes bacterium]|nr:3-phosphoshikimate 1-carboxyvinyltransferase [Planctomycetota bacterium]
MGAVIVSPPQQFLNLALHAPVSKSHALRGLVLAATSAGAELQVGEALPTDVLVMVDALRVLGAHIEHSAGMLNVTRPVDVAISEPVTLDAGEGGAPARFLLALAAGLRRPVTITGHGRLPQRPFAALIHALRALGACVDGEDGLPLTVRGPALGGAVRLDASASSQFISALLLAAPLYSRGVTVQIAGPCGSQPYVSLTCGVMREFGLDVGVRSDAWHVAAGQRPRGGVWRCESDWSGAAVLLSAAALTGGRVHVSGVSAASLQPDAAICGILEAAGCFVQHDVQGVTCSGAMQRGLDLDLRHTPDLAPPLAALAAGRPYSSRLSGLGALRHKESDRLEGLRAMLQAVDVPCHIASDALLIQGGMVPGPRVPLEVQRDHRLAMAAALFGLAREVAIDDAGCVQKSFPDFFHQWPCVELL